MAQRKGETREEYLARRREQDRQRRADPEYREREREYARNRRADPEYRERDRERARQRRADPEYREAENARRLRSHHERMANDPEFKARFRAGITKRRRMKANTAVEPIINREVFERDGWQCGICHGLIHPDDTYPHPQSASLDHIVPLSLGGTHTYDNVRLTCLRCNIARGNRIGETA